MLDTEQSSSSGQFLLFSSPMTCVVIMAKLIVTLIYHLSLCQPGQSVGGCGSGIKAFPELLKSPFSLAGMAQWLSIDL